MAWGSSLRRPVAKISSVGGSRDLRPPAPPGKRDLPAPFHSLPASRKLRAMNPATRHRIFSALLVWLWTYVWLQLWGL
jgi:hypothetical protein